MGTNFTMNWISTEEYLPPEEMRVLIIVNLLGYGKTIITTGLFYIDRNNRKLWVLEIPEICHFDVTHWTLLPELPK